MIPSKLQLLKIQQIKSYNLDSSKLLRTGFKPKENRRCNKRIKRSL